MCRGRLAPLTLGGPLGGEAETKVGEQVVKKLASSLAGHRAEALRLVLIALVLATSGCRFGGVPLPGPIEKELAKVVTN